MRKFLTIILAIFITTSVVQVIQIAPILESKAIASSYSCSGGPVGSVSCGGFGGSVNCYIAGLLQSATCTDSYGHSVSCSSSLFGGSLSVSCPSFPVPYVPPTPTPTPTPYRYVAPTPTPTPYSFGFSTPTPTPYSFGFSTPTPYGYSAPTPTYTSGNSTQGCASVPAAPVVTQTQDALGVTFYVTPVLPPGQTTIAFRTRDISGQSGSKLFGYWSPWYSLGQYRYFNSQYFWSPSAGRTSFGFGVEAVNNCGVSSETRAFAQQGGGTVEYSKFTQSISPPRIETVHLPNNSDSNLVILLAYTTASLPVSLVSDTSDICEPALPLGSLYAHILRPGICKIRFSQAGNDEYSPAPDVQIQFQVLPPIKTATSKTIFSVVCTKGPVTKRVSGKNPSCPAGYKKK